MIYDAAAKDVHSQKGVTLTEASLVIALGALILMGSFLAFNTVVKQKRSTQLMIDVVAIRTAVIKWSDGGILVYDKISDEHDPRSLTSWVKIAPYLPSPLRELAESSNNTINSQNRVSLSGANPWDGDYVLRFHAPREPRKWTLEIRGVGHELSTSLFRQLATTGVVGANRSQASPGNYTIELTYEE